MLYCYNNLRMIILYYYNNDMIIILYYYTNNMIIILSYEHNNIIIENIISNKSRKTKAFNFGCHHGSNYLNGMSTSCNRQPFDKI